VKPTTDGGYIMTGYTDSIGAGLYDLLLVKTDSEGSTEWSRAFGGGGRDYGNSVVPTADGGYLAAGYTLSYGAGGDDVYLVRADAEGNLEWQTTYGGSASDVGYAVAKTLDGGYAVAGHTLSFGAGLHDVWLIRLAAEEPSAAPAPGAAAAVKLEIRPNPFIRSVAMHYTVPRPTAVQLYIHDASGRLVRTIRDEPSRAGRHIIAWNCLSRSGSPVAPGVYFCRFEAAGLETVTKMVRLE
jgi:hypothetical protein